MSSLFELHVNYHMAHKEMLLSLLETFTILDFMLANIISKEMRIEDMFKTQ